MRKENINHINYPDASGNIYCRMENALIKYDIEHCSKCPLMSGSAQGKGVECYYYDAVFKTQIEPIVDTPNNELMRISQLIDRKIVDKPAIRR